MSDFARMPERSFRLFFSHAGGALEGLRAWAAALPQARRVELDLLADDAQAQHRQAMPNRVAGPVFVASVSLWAPEGPAAPPPSFDMHAYEVADREGFGFEGERLGEVPGFKKTTLWKARDGLTRQEWDPLYAHHILTVRDNQPMWRYRQNLILRGPAGSPFDAISENWWSSAADLHGGFFRSDGARQAVLEETRQFIDLAVTSNFVSRNFLLVRTG